MAYGVPDRDDTRFTEMYQVLVGIVGYAVCIAVGVACLVPAGNSCGSILRYTALQDPTNF